MDLASTDLGDGRYERQVLRFGVRAVFRATGDGDVELAGKVGELLVPQKRVGELAHDR